MGIKIREWLFGKSADAVILNGCTEIETAAAEYYIRQLAFYTCVNMIANAVSKCEFKTYKNGEEVQGNEYYSWNIEPNRNENSTAMLHKLIYRLYCDNEALIVGTGRRDGREMRYVADAFMKSVETPESETVYSDVLIGDFGYSRMFRESEVLHFKLNASDLKPVIDGLYNSYAKMIAATVKNYTTASGKHLKVHVNQIAQGVAKDGRPFEEVFREKIEKEIKPFMQSENGVLPEFDGYTFSEFGDKSAAAKGTRDIRALYDDIFDFTAMAFGIPPVLLFGDVAGTKDAMQRWLTICIDPLCDQIQEEINRKIYGFAGWEKGNYMRIDTSAILHFDIFGEATNIEKLIGSGAFSVNDVRKAAGQTPINETWADGYFMTKNFETMENVTDVKGGDKDA